MTESRLRTETETGLEQFVHDERGVSFTNGIMHVMRQAQRPVEVARWESSNGMTVYTTVKWRDPITGELRTSCNCPGWVMKRRDRRRRCCHTDDMEGVKVCSRTRVDSMAIHSLAEAAEAIPEVHGGRELREINLDSW
jgi:hypothetical protein